MIVVTDIAKSFGTLAVLKGLSLHIERGKVTAIAGPNASGKTTLIKAMLGLIRPDAGTILFDGTPLNGDSQYRARIGYMPQVARFPENLSAREVIAMLKDLRGNPTLLDEDLLETFQIEAELDKPLRTLSGGTRQKISAIIAFLFRPDVVILDEPTAGLDPVASSVLKDKILRERDAGTTFILTSHIMSEIEALADNIAFLLDGTMQYDGTMALLKQRTGQHQLERAIAQMMIQDKQAA
jgi:Cu-processing system ATP-binding protein